VGDPCSISGIGIGIFSFTVTPLNGDHFTSCLTAIQESFPVRNSCRSRQIYCRCSAEVIVAGSFVLRSWFTLTLSYLSHADPSQHLSSYSYASKPKISSSHSFRKFVHSGVAYFGLNGDQVIMILVHGISGFLLRTCSPLLAWGDAEISFCMHIFCLIKIKCLRLLFRGM
jgi:hypothetical protein